ncbi:hypothetical protein CALCODRAFT_485197 [Calocera cornea HHB12733]|uniref:Microtubule associated protein n=1 Tax=Calocera cornea HHB12733 TaxID=1353952 RepID=A0A165EHG0_9BASI|nr:hypothetical protein CALCODRAFT_485197 [Calocera cornea HHB12733]
MAHPAPLPLTPSTLLPALQAPLQALTHALPALHHTLALPPDALAHDLASLRDALLRAIDHHLTRRQHEVSAWHARCTNVEIRVRTLRRTLGAWANGIADGSVEENEVLPRRLELLTQQEHKLSGLHAAKLEQLSLLAARLHALAPSLPAGFLPAAYLHISPAPAPAPAARRHSAASTSTAASHSQPGEAREAHKANEAHSELGGERDVEPEPEPELEDVSPERFDALEHELVRAKAEITSRLTHLCHLFSDLLYLHTDLVLPFPSPPTPGDHLRASTASASGAGGARGEACPMTSAEPEALFAQFIARLEEVETEGFEPGDDLTGMEGIDPTPAVTQWAEALKQQLEALKAEREGRIQEIYDTLEGLWRRLGVREDEVDGFVEANRGSSERCVLAYEHELERMQALKREKMVLFVSNAREEVQALWDEMMYGEEERERFAPFFDGASSFLFAVPSPDSARFTSILLAPPEDHDHSEELLTRHEDEIERLRAERAEKAPILSHVQKYFQLCDEERELEAAAQDPTRLLGKRGDAGRLLREEKMRKRVQREKPKLEKELLDVVPAWEAQHDRVLLVYGQPLRGLIEESISASEMQKENKRLHKGAKPPAARSQTPAEPPARKRAPSALANPSTVKRQKIAHGPQPPATAPPAARSARPLGIATNVYETPGFAVPHTAGKLPATAVRSASASVAVTGYGKLGYGAPPTTTMRLPTSSSVFGSTVRIPSATEERIRKAQQHRSKKESFRPRPSAIGFAGGIAIGAGIRPAWEAVTEEEEP